MSLLEKEIDEYITLLDKLYAKSNIIVGVDTTPLNIIKPEKYMDGLLYYDNGKLTDKFFIRNVVSAPSFNKENPIYCLGQIKVGDYVCTSDMYGVCMKAPDETVAFGKVVGIIENKGRVDKNEYMEVRLINVEFFE